MTTELEERKKKSIFNSIIKSSKTNVEPVRKLHLLNSKGQTHPTVQVGLKQANQREGEICQQPRPSGHQLMKWKTQKHK